MQQDKSIKHRILVAISGGIAAYKCAELVRLLVKQNAEVRVVMTHGAQEFITPLTLQALSGNAVHTELFSASQEQAMGHIELARWAQTLVIAPATANVLAKLSHGIADDLLTTLYLVAECPVFIAPAMNQAMWHKAVTQENIQRLQQQGATIIGPAAGEQACGDVGVGRMSEPDIICAAVCAYSSNNALAGKTVLLTAGPTREPIDPVRYITNRSSGKMGYALAAAAVQAGAKQVILVSGPVSIQPPPGVNCILIETAAQMYAAVMQQIATCDIFIGAAAVADYTPSDRKASKIKKQASEISLALEKTQDILAAVAALPVRPFTVGFAAETDNLEQYARDKLQQKNLDMIAANWVGREQGGFDRDLNELHVYWANGAQTLRMMPKTILATHLIKLIAERFNA